MKEKALVKEKMLEDLIFEQKSYVNKVKFLCNKIDRFLMKMVFKGGGVQYIRLSSDTCRL